MDPTGSSEMYPELIRPDGLIEPIWLIWSNRVLSDLSDRLTKPNRLIGSNR